MFKVMLALHLLTAIFAIGPLVHASTTASRGLRQKDAAALSSSARTIKIYSIVSVVVVIFGFGLMSADAPWGTGGEKVASFSEAWIWISALLWLVAVGLCHGLVIPPLEKAAADVELAPSFTAKVAAGGGLIGLIFAVIVVLMVYRPGA
ncbi:hypothetical protein [Nocardioides nematodiphilus]|uniref:hypothetical protein n=1 Tax=Nocardioides nematodiphilus TaxID=2849669 RepID=UPI001CD99EF9|nr:hypothetical protein [Nocardioides nematodiphilus]MCA1982257.1 hypothetical protein [Nocardioides nematodiphilus]